MTIVQTNPNTYYTRYGEPIAVPTDNVSGATNPQQSTNNSNSSQFGDAVQIDINGSSTQNSGSDTQGDIPPGQ